MTRRYFSPALFAVSLALSFIHHGAPSIAYAEDKEVIIRIDSDIEPVRAVGLVLTSDGTTEKSDAKFARSQSGNLEVTFSYTSEEAGSDALATAMVQSSDGSVAFGHVRKLSAINGSRDLPVCKGEKLAIAPNPSQIGLLQSLVDVRSARRELVQAKVSNLMKDDFLEMLKKLESGFGLTYAKELSPSLPPVELIDRLTRILNAVKNYRMSKANRSAPEPAPEQ